jgi:hypothetical protein
VDLTGVLRGSRFARLPEDPPRENDHSARSRIAQRRVAGHFDLVQTALRPEIAVFDRDRIAAQTADRPAMTAKQGRFVRAPIVPFPIVPFPIVPRLAVPLLVRPVLVRPAIVPPVRQRAAGLSALQPARQAIDPGPGDQTQDLESSVLAANSGLEAMREPVRASGQRGLLLVETDRLRGEVARHAHPARGTSVPGNFVPEPAASPQAVQRRSLSAQSQQRAADPVQAGQAEASPVPAANLESRNAGATPLPERTRAVPSQSPEVVNNGRVTVAGRS